MSSLNKEWATRDLVFHFGGSWVVENSKKNGTLYKYEGGRVNRVDGVADFSISFQTLVDISKISFPEICMKTLNCYYLVDGVKILIDCDDDLKFQWETIPPDCNGLTHYYLDAYAPTESILSPTPPKTTQTSCILDLGTPSKKTPPSKNTVQLDSPARNTRSSNTKLFDCPPIPTPSKSRRVEKKKLPVKRKAVVVDEVDAENVDLVIDLSCFDNLFSFDGINQTQQSEVMNEKADTQAGYSQAAESSKRTQTAEMFEPESGETTPTISMNFEDIIFTEFGDGNIANREPNVMNEKAGNTQAAESSQRTHAAEFGTKSGETEQPNVMNENADTQEWRRPVQSRVYNVNLNEVHAEEEYVSEHSSEEDSDYHEEVGDDEDSDVEDVGLEIEDEGIPSEADFLPQFNDIAQQTFECTEEVPFQSSRMNLASDVCLVVGQEFPSIYKCRNHLRYYAIMKKFEIFWKKNDVDKIIALCNVKGCPWRCYASRLNDGFTMVVKNLKDEHTCPNSRVNENSLASARWVAEMIEDEMRMHHTSFTPKDIVKLVWHKYTCTIKYWLAWKARGKALEKVHGNYELSYSRMPELCRQIQITNPGSIVSWKACPVSRKFTYLGVAFRASLDGFLKGCRLIVGLDGCHLKGKYSGVCLCAIGMDANSGMFPLGICICSKENFENWNQFLSLLAPELHKHSEPLTIMSDRCKGLKKAVVENFPQCNQRFCFRHMLKNLNRYWRGDHLMGLCWAAASCYRQPQFKRHIEELDKLSSGAKAYLMKEKCSLWARSYFDLTSKSDHMTNNWTESFNSFILQVRDKPICALVTGVSFLCMKIRYERNLEASKLEEGGLVPRVLKVIEEYKLKKNEYLIEPSGDGTYCIRHYNGLWWTVDLTKHTCGCGEWQVTGIPCVHAVHLIDSHRYPFVQFCSPYFSVKAYKDAYAYNIKPIPHENEWDEANEVVLPPISSRMPGRPKNNRYKNAEEDDTQQPRRNMKKCGKCGGFGHNSRSCQGGPVASTGRGRGRGTQRGRGTGRGRGNAATGRSVTAGTGGRGATAAGGRGATAGGRGTTAAGGRGATAGGRGTTAGTGRGANAAGAAAGRSATSAGIGGTGATVAGGRGGNPTGGRGANPTVGGGRGTGRGGTLTIPLPPPTRVQVPQRKKVFKPPRQNYIP